MQGGWHRSYPFAGGRGKLSAKSNMQMLRVVLLMIGLAGPVLAQSGAVSLEAEVFVPPGAGAEAPVVLVLHGAGGTGPALRRRSGFDQIARAQGLVAVYPTAPGRRWNDGRQPDEPRDDVAALLALVARVVEGGVGDAGRLYVVGHSNGGGMAMRLACAVPERLAGIAAGFAPDIAIHFGLSARAEGFTLERLARNEIAADRPDNSGVQPHAACIVEGGEGHPSTLPLDAIAAALSEAGLPHSWSDNAGGYLCNYVFYLSRSPHFAEYAPEMSGFVHVPPLAGPDAPVNAMRLGDLVAGARVIVKTCAENWAKARAA